MEPVLAFITLAGSNPRSSLYSAVCATWLPWKDASASADGAAAESSTADAMAPVDDGDRGGDRGQRGRTWPTVASFFPWDGSITTRLRRYPMASGARVGPRHSCARKEWAGWRSVALGRRDGVRAARSR